MFVVKNFAAFVPGGVWNAGPKFLGILGDELVIDPVLERAQDDDGPRVVDLDLLPEILSNLSFVVGDGGAK